MIDDQVVYYIKRRTEKHRRYNDIHKHLAHELRNIPGSHVSCESDIYSLGYNFLLVSQLVATTVEFRSIAGYMMHQEPSKRMKLPPVSRELKKIFNRQ